MTACLLAGVAWAAVARAQAVAPAPRPTLETWLWRAHPPVAEVLQPVLGAPGAIWRPTISGGLLANHGWRDLFDVGTTATRERGLARAFRRPDADLDGPVPEWALPGPALYLATGEARDRGAAGQQAPEAFAHALADLPDACPAELVRATLLQAAPALAHCARRENGGRRGAIPAVVDVAVGPDGRILTGLVHGPPRTTPEVCLAGLRAAFRLPPGRPCRVPWLLVAGR